MGLGALWHKLAVQPAYLASKSLSRKGLYPFLKQEAEKITNGQRVLSVGAGGQVGTLLLRHASRKGFQLEQMDISETRQPDILADLCTWNAPETYDVIFVSEVLEHVKEPRAAVDNLYASLKPGGLLIITTPFIFPIHESPYDHYRYTRHGLAHLLAEFEDTEIRERNSWAEALLVLLARTSTSDTRWLSVFSPFFVALSFILYPFAWLTGRLMPSNFFTTGYLVSARKLG